MTACRDALAASGAGLVPKSCPTCGLGPCQRGVQPVAAPAPLPPCPFCGAAAHSTILFGHTVVGCRTHGCIVGQSWNPVALWSQRAPVPAADRPDLVAAARQARSVLRGVLACAPVHMRALAALGDLDAALGPDAPPVRASAAFWLGREGL